MKILALSDSPMPSGFGRISNEVFERLARRGHQVHVVSLLWDGIAAVDIKDWYSPTKHKYSFQISGVAGRDPYAYLYNLVNLAQPDIVMSVQDFPYATNLYYNSRIDWSRRAFVVITPIDGEPIYEDWLRLVDDADGTMVISEFGVAAMKRAGRKVALCPPGIDMHDFKPLSPDEKKALRAKAGIPENAFVLGMMAMNQGRKDIPHTLDGFVKFAIDKPDARLLLDMEKISPAGWHIPYLMKTKGIPPEKVIFKEDLVKSGVLELRERFSLLNAHVVLAHREGFGLPLVEGQAMKIPTIAMDWCSGTEICGNGKGYLVRRLPQPRSSTWGNADDYDPDVEHFVQILETIYSQPAQAAAIAEEGYRWASARTWDKTADAVEFTLMEVEEGLNERRKRDSAGVQPVANGAQIGSVPSQIQPAAPQGSDNGGRLQPGVRPEGDNGSAIQRSEELNERGFLQDGEHRGPDGQGQTLDVPELGYRGPQPVA